MPTGSNTTRIAKNTLLLYFRQILIMLVSLYTVRVVLNVLGEEDYGIYNVVGGIVVLFAFVNNAMAEGTQRFLNYALGLKDNKKVNETYSASLIIHFVIAVFFVIAAETIGLWFVNCKLNIPEQRHYAALIVYQFTIVTTVLGIMRVPYHAVVIAYEKMSFFAWLSIVEAVLKLVIVYLLSIANYDKLIFYAFLITVITALILIIYKVYCNRQFTTANYTKVSDKQLTKELVGFSSWSLLGATANVCNNQGVNLILNMFTSVAVNAAYGISNQINAAVNSFIGNFQVAFKPHIVKVWAEGDKTHFYHFVKKTMILSVFLQSLVAVPLLINLEFVLKLWLSKPPEYTRMFVFYMLLASLIGSVNGPLWMAVQATGNIRNYQIVVSALVLLNIPSDIVLLSLDYSPLCVVVVKIIVDFIITIYRFWYAKMIIKFHLNAFLFQKVTFCVLGIVSSYLTGMFVRNIADNEALSFLLSCLSSVLTTIIILYFFALDKEDRLKIRNKIESKIRW